MSSETIEVKKREGSGTLACKKIRREGNVPAILYGHGEENVNLSVRADTINKVIRHGSKLLNLTGELSETALLKDVQWDAFGIEILHVDFTRVSNTETVEVTLPIELHGEAPGTNQGGMLGFSSHEITISCPAASIPDHIQVNVSQLNLGDSIHANELQLPEGASLVSQPSTLIVQVAVPSGMKGQGGAEDEEEATEPEVISKGADSEETSE